MGCFGEASITETCDLCGDVKLQKVFLGQFTDLPRPFLAPFEDWIWTSDGHTYCPSCWMKMRIEAGTGGMSKSNHKE
jgi:hypothetical protein